MRATGVIIRNRDSRAEFIVHDECLAYLQRLAPDAWDPFYGSFVVIGPAFGDYSCGMGHNCQH